MNPSTITRSQVRVAPVLPTVGTHGSYSVGSDAYPLTVVEVSKSGHRVVCEQDEYKAVSGDIYSGNVVYEFTRREGGNRIVFTRRANGRYRQAGSKTTGGLSLNGWFAKYDPSF